MNRTSKKNQNKKKKTYLLSLFFHILSEKISDNDREMFHFSCLDLLNWALCFVLKSFIRAYPPIIQQQPLFLEDALQVLEMRSRTYQAGSEC